MIVRKNTPDSYMALFFSPEAKKKVGDASCTFLFDWMHTGSPVAGYEGNQRPRGWLIHGNVFNIHNHL